MGEIKNQLLRFKHFLFGYTPPLKLGFVLPLDNTSPLGICASFTAMQEGGYSGDMRDGGNWSSGKPYKGVFIGSKFGVSAPTALRYFGSYFTQTQMQNLSIKDYETVYKGEIWNPVKGDSLPTGLSLMVCDHGYNRGCATSLMLLQRCVSVKADGIMGPNTLNAIKTYIKNSSLESLLGVLYKQQVDDYAKLNMPTYEAGWLNRCLNRYVKAKSLIGETNG